jgi:hypothetical protein
LIRQGVDRFGGSLRFGLPWILAVFGFLPKARAVSGLTSGATGC